MALLDPHRLRPPRNCHKTLSLAEEQTPADCLFTVMCQWRQAAALGEAVHASARAEVPVAAQAQEEAAVVASQPAP